MRRLLLTLTLVLLTVNATAAPQLPTLPNHWLGGLQRGLRAVVGLEALAAYQNELAAVVGDRNGWRVPLTELLSPLFTLAQTRSARSSAAAEHRALLIVVAAYTNRRSLATLLPDAAQPRPLVVTLRGRKDWAQHFMLAAALAATGGDGLADQLGLLKEVDDADGGSGFSFTDLAAGRAGTRFGQLAVHAGAGAQSVQKAAARGLHESDVLPVIADLPEFMTAHEFAARYGGIGTPAYEKVVADIEQRLDTARLFR